MPDSRPGDTGSVPIGDPESPAADPEPDVTLTIRNRLPSRSFPPGGGYVGVTLSMYDEDRAFLDYLVRRCKAEGCSRMSASKLVRLALRHLAPDLDRVVIALERRVKPPGRRLHRKRPSRRIS